MLQDILTTALKEWAVVQRSLLEGHQILLLRKGGLIEDAGDFDLKARQFLIYPTYEHETERAGDLQPCFRQYPRRDTGQPWLSYRQRPFHGTTAFVIEASTPSVPAAL